MKCVFNLMSFVLMGLVSAEAGAAVRLFDAIQKELPVGAYTGKTHQRGDCQVQVSVTDDARFGQVYTVELTHQGTALRQSFELRLRGEHFGTVGARDVHAASYRYESGLRPYVANTRRDPRTSIVVLRGQDVESSLRISDLNDSRSRPRNKWRITVGEAKNTGSENPFGDLSCEIAPL